jgi:hypothetical protein
VTWPLLLAALWLAVLAWWFVLARADRRLREHRQRRAAMPRHPSAGGPPPKAAGAPSEKPGGIR